MATKTFKVRAKLKFDSLENWISNDPVLLKGEPAIVEITSGSDKAYMMKIGDGTSKFSALSFVGAPATDVYDWAKSESKPTYSVSEIEGLEKAIEDAVKSGNNEYQLVYDGSTLKLQIKDKSDESDSWKDQNVINLGKIISATSPVWNISVSKSGSSPSYPIIKCDVSSGKRDFLFSDGTTTSINSDTFQIITQPNTYYALRLKDADGSYAINNVNATQLSKLTPTTDLIAIFYCKSTENSLDVIYLADGIVLNRDNDITIAGYASPTAIVNRLDSLENESSSLDKRLESVEDTLDELDEKFDAKQDVIIFNSPYSKDTNKAATMKDVTDATSGLAGALHWKGEVDSEPTAETAQNYNEGDVVSYNNKEYVCESKAGVKGWRELGDESNHHNHSNLSTLEKITESKLEGWDKAASEIDDKSDKNHTHDISTLTQNDDDYIVFDCGSASDVI